MINQTITLLDLQRRQQRHDKAYHPDILALSTADRLKHMALHNAKYAAKLCDAEYQKDDTAFEKVLVDAFVISIATANTLTLNLTNSMLPVLNEGLKEKKSENLRPFSHRYLREAGLMAKSCESIDHLEDFPFRATITLANLNMVILITTEADTRRMSIFKQYEARLKDVEEKSGFRIFDDGVSD